MAAARTAADTDIIVAIRRLSHHLGYPPTMRELGHAIGLASTSSTHARIRRLEHLGWITRDPKRPRSILITARGNLATPNQED